ncbi:unnamed protein product [Caenorhabditis brenneri]
MMDYNLTRSMFAIRFKLTVQVWGKISKMGFPLSRLPLLAILEVLTTMNPFEIINFSISSLRFKRIVKQFFRSGSEFEILLYFQDKAVITLKGTQHYWDYEFTSEQKYDNILKYDPENNTETLTKYSTDLVESFFNLFKYIDDLMNSQKNRPSFTRDVKPIKWFNLDLEENVGNDVISIFNHVEDVKFLNLTVPFNGDFEIIFPYSLSYLCIENGQWVKLRHLLEFTSSEIEMKESKLTALELCTFFQSWILSESQLNLKKLEIDIEKHEIFENISQNLPHEEADDSRRAPTIRRNDETIATILLFCSNFNPEHLLLGMVVE